jgi:hypothetical protein
MWLLLATLVFSFANCATFGQAPFAEESSSKVDLREAIFRYMFAHYNYGASTEIFCIQPETPQPERFLRRFFENRPRVVWGFDCSGSEPMNGIIERKTGKRAVRMTIQGIRWISSIEAEANVEAYSDGIAANSNILRITRGKGRWVVKQDQPNGIS